MEPTAVERSMGYRYSIDYLRSLNGRVAQMTREEQAQYADENCRQIAKNDYAVADYTEFLNPDTADFSRYNTSTVANLAYISLVRPNPKIEKVLEKYQAWSRATTMA